MPSLATTFRSSSDTLDRRDAHPLVDQLSEAVHAWTTGVPTPSLQRVLAMWRQAESDLDAATPGTDSWNEAGERCLAARSEYQRLFRLAAVDADDLRRPG